MSPPDPRPSTSSGFSRDIQKRKSSSLQGKKTETRSRDVAPIEGEKGHPAAGLKQTWHGNSFQLKLLMLFLHCGVENGYAFRLCTEHTGAGKFDDLVFQYRKEKGGEIFCLFLQAKHSRDEKRKIKACHLLAGNDDDFSLRKYFVSYTQIKKDPNLRSGKLEDFLICTNIGFDREDLAANDISLKKIDSPHEFLDFQSGNAARYKLVDPKPDSELHKILAKTSDGHVLATTLAEHVSKKEKITLGTNVFKLHLRTLVDQGVIDAEKNAFTDNFKNNRLTNWPKEFHRIFCAELERTKFKKNDESMKNMWTRIEKEKRLCLAQDLKRQLKKAPKNQLPNLKLVDPNFISKFLDELVFAVDQPDEVDLGRELAHRLADVDEIDLENPELAYTSLLNKMEDWFKDKKGVWLTDKDGKDFLKSIEGDINTLMCSGISLSYLTEIKKYGIEFENENRKLENFLVPSSINEQTPSLQALNVIAKGDTFLTVARIYQTIERTQRYAKYDSLMIIRLSTLLDPDVKGRVIRAFGMELSHNLLVIDCGSDSAQYLHKLKKLLDELRKSTKGKTTKRLILVTPGCQVSSDTSDNAKKLFENCDDRENDEIGFNDLAETSRRRLLSERIIVFQGLQDEPISFKELFEFRCFEGIILMKSPNYQELIDSSTLMMIIRGEKIKVGNRLQELNELEDIYMSRRVNRVFIKPDGLESSSSPDVIATSPDEGGKPKQFAVLCENYPGSNVHWLKRFGKELIWNRTHGSIADLSDHRDANRISRFVSASGGDSLSEDQLAGVNELGKVVIISENSGMGKTTLFTSLAKKLQATRIYPWVIRINLNDVTKELDEQQKQGKGNFVGNDPDRTVDFFINKLSKLETPLEKKFLKNIIGDRGGVMVLLDGFDEIIPYYKDSVKNLLVALKNLSGVEKIFISTRPITKDFLENCLGVFSHTITPLVPSEQIDLLVRFFKAGLGLDDNVGGRIRQYAQDLITRLKDSIGYDNREFFGLPLHLRMIARVYRDNEAGGDSFESCQKFLNSNHDRPWLPVKITIVDLYRRFFARKRYTHSKEKKKADFTNPFVRLEIETGHEAFLKKHQELALYALLEPTDLDTLLPDWKDKENIRTCMDTMNPRDVRTELVTHLVNGKPRFAHRSFAEYSVASFLINILKRTHFDRKLQRFFIERILLPVEHRRIRTFLNGMLREGSPSVDLTAEHKVSAAESWKSLIENHRSDLGHTIFQVAETEGYLEVVKFILHPFLPLDQSWKDLLNAERPDPLVRHVDYQSLMEMVKYYIEHCGVDPNELYLWEKTTPLHLAARRGDLPNVEWLVGKGADPTAETKDDESPLTLATNHNKFAVVKWLIDQGGVAVHYADKNGRTALHHAAEKDALEIFQWLVEEKSADIEDTDQQTNSALKLAVEKLSWKVVSWLIKKFGDEYESPDGSTIVEKVGSSVDNFIVGKGLSFGKADLVPFLNAYSGLEEDLRSFDLEALRWLVTRGVAVNLVSLNDHISVPAIYVTHDMLNVLQWWKCKTNRHLTFADCDLSRMAPERS